MESGSEKKSPPGSFWRRASTFLRVLGPGLITANVDNDAGGIATYSQAGARFGFRLLWSFLPVTFLLILVQEMVNRMGVVTGQGLSDLIRERFGVRVTFYVMLLVIGTNFGNVMGEFAGIASAAPIFGVPSWLAVPVCAVLVWLLVLKGSYGIVERVFLIIIRPELREVGWALITPTLSVDRDYLVMLIGVVGTTIAPWMQFYQQASVAEKNIHLDDYGLSRLDTIIGGIVVSLVAGSIVVACAHTIHVAGLRIEEAGAGPAGGQAQLNTLCAGAVERLAVRGQCAAPLDLLRFLRGHGLGVRAGQELRLCPAVLRALHADDRVAGSDGAAARPLSAEGDVLVPGAERPAAPHRPGRHPDPDPGSTADEGLGQRSCPQPDRLGGGCVADDHRRRLPGDVVPGMSALALFPLPPYSRTRWRRLMSEWTLTRNRFPARPGPVLLVVMDGIGLGRPDEGNAVQLAHKPVLDRIWAGWPTTRLKAHGTAVGLPSDDDMGNSEVGHNAIGAGRVYDQGAKRVNAAIEDGSLFAGEAWRNMVRSCREHGTPMHFIGLLSDGNVHSHIDQLFALIRECRRAGLEQVCVHPLLDGRDVPETSALKYIDALEELLDGINREGGSRTWYRIASGGGRMLVTMDRYQANWGVVERGWKAHVLGQGRPFASAREAVETYRREIPGVIDQFLPEFVVVKDGKPVGTIEDGHSVVNFNFRGDRAIEISRAFDDEDFPYFDRRRRPAVLYAGLMQYDGDLLIPRTFLVPPPAISQTMGEYLARNGIPQLACAETQKYGHVTYFWNGNRSGKFDEKLEEYVEIPSDIVPFEQRPWMKSAEITDRTIELLRSGLYRWGRINFPNGDMVGHTGVLQAAIVAVDLALGRLLPVIRDLHGMAIITADHGNSEEMFERKNGKVVTDAAGNPKAKTSHTLNPVPFIIFDPDYAGEYRLKRELERPGLSNIAATIMQLLGFVPPEDYDESLIEFGQR